MEVEEVTLSVITVNYNGFADTCELIDSIPSSSTISLEVIVVDNGSERNEATLIGRKFPHVRAIRSEENLGFAGGNNLGIKAARGRYLFFVNNDTVFRGDWHVGQLIQRLDSSDSIGMVCPKIRFAWGSSPIQFAGYTKLSAITMRNRAIGYNEEDRGQYDTPHPTPYAHGAAMMIKRAALEKAGLMPECFFLYYEELDWSLQIRRAGFDIWYEPACSIFHKESQSTGQESPLRTYFISRNRLLFVQRNVRGATKYLSYFYLIVVVGLRDVLKYALHKRTDLTRATVSGINNFLKMK